LARHLFTFTPLAPARCIADSAGGLQSAHFIASYGESRRSRLWSLPSMHP